MGSFNNGVILQVLGVFTLYFLDWTHTPVLLHELRYWHLSRVFIHVYLAFLLHAKLVKVTLGLTFEHVLPSFTLFSDFPHHSLLLVVCSLVLIVATNLQVIVVVYDCITFQPIDINIVVQPLKTLRNNNLYLNVHDEVYQGFAPELGNGQLLSFFVYNY